MVSNGQWFGKDCSSLHSSSCPHTYCIIKTSSIDWKILYSQQHSWVPLLSLAPLSFLLSFTLSFPSLSISLFPSTYWPSQAGLGLYISGFEATSETKAKLWVWFGLRRAQWPRHVVFLGQTRERWGGEKNLCESSCVFEENPNHSKFECVISRRGWSKLGLTSDGVKSTYYRRHHVLFLFCWVIFGGT